MMEIRMPSDIVEGKECLDLGIPWQTEGSIYKEDEILNKEDMALEIGTGGSTLFLARRCKSVTAIEQNIEWANMVSARLVSESIDNVLYAFVNEDDKICDLIRDSDTSAITVFSVDPEGNYNRSKILDAFLSKGISPSLRVLIIDNYSHPGLFPDHHDKVIMSSPEWEYFSYDHERWVGSGTRIYVKK